MSTRLCGLVLALVFACATGVLYAQTPADPQRAQQEKDAEVLFMQGEARMKVASYEDALVEFNNVLKRYPSTQMRYTAQFRLADALVALKREPDALEQLQAIVKEESQTWSPKALEKIGQIYTGQQKYSDAFRVYRQIIADYPDNPMVDHAYFAIGITHFRLGHFEQAAKELDKVGTVYASTIAELQRVSPGDPLYIRLFEPNLVATATTTLPITLTSKSGDTEVIQLSPEVEGGEYFTGFINTVLGGATLGDGILQLHGNDLVTMAYKTRYIGEGSRDRSMVMTVATNGNLLVRDSQGNEVKGVVAGDMMTIEVDDPDRDESDTADSLTLDLKTKKKDVEKLTLTETGPHTGIFQTKIAVAKTNEAPMPNSGKVESNAAIAEGTATQLDDTITLTYQDEQNLSVKDAGPRKVNLAVALFGADDGTVESVDAKIQNTDLEVKTLLYKGRSLTQIAATYRDLGQDALGIITFRKATAQFMTILTNPKFRGIPEVEDALYGLFQNYVEQGAYDAAITVVNQITRQFPQSTRASEAMLQLAEVHVKREEYDRALAIYSTLVNTAKGTPLAEKAQYAICTTYMEIFKPKSSKGTERIIVTRDQVTAALEQFVRVYPASELAPDAYWQLVRFRYDGEDYRGAVDTSRRMVALYPDSVMTGRVLLLQGQGLYKLRDINGAKETFRTVIANYGDQSDPARKLLNELETKFTPKPPAAAGGTTTPAGTK